MDGINYLTNEKIAVQIDLEKHGALWEDFYDLLFVQMRKDEDSLDWEDAEKLLKEKKLL